MTLPPASEIDAAYVVRRLEEAFQTMLAMEVHTGHKTVGAQFLGYTPEVAECIEAASIMNLRRAMATEISAMDEANDWLAYITNRTIRKIVALRSVRRPHRVQCPHTWRKIGEAVGASHEACRAWHAKGVAQIVARLRGAPC